MKQHYLILASLLALRTFAEDLHQKLSPPPGKELTGPEWYGDNVQKLIPLDQNWDIDDRNRFYKTTQGSHLLPYEFFMALEQTDSTAVQPILFRTVRNMQKFRLIPNLDGGDELPIGFVSDPDKDPQRRWRGLVSNPKSLGLTCAACHTTQINYKGVGLRIDGGPTMADLDSFMLEMTASLVSTEKDNDKFARFALRVLGKNFTSEESDRLRAILHDTVRERVRYNEINHSDVSYGFGRLDAFGRIFNNVLMLVDPLTHGVKANAPVSFPYLWDAPRANWVQWTAIAHNTGVGPLGRNVGEVIGVFAAIDVGNPPPSAGYRSSVNIPNLLSLERLLTRLESPVWPEKVLGSIDKNKRDAGARLYHANCAICHHNEGFKRDDSKRQFAVDVEDIKTGVETDSLTAQNILKGSGSRGFLGKPGETDTAVHIVADTARRVILGKLPFVPNIHDGPVSLKKLGLNESLHLDGSLSGEGEPAMIYKARPLNGIWATAPYLHNGSVPSLYELLLPPERRIKTFSVGTREYDPQRVGIDVSVKPGSVPGLFTFDTSLPGNRNVGHNYGTWLEDEQRWQLVEYLKSL